MCGGGWTAGATDGAGKSGSRAAPRTGAGNPCRQPPAGPSGGSTRARILPGALGPEPLRGPASALDRRDAGRPAPPVRARCGGARRQPAQQRPARRRPGAGGAGGSRGAPAGAPGDLDRQLGCVRGGDPALGAADPGGEGRIPRPPSGVPDPLRTCGLGNRGMDPGPSGRGGPDRGGLGRPVGAGDALGRARAGGRGCVRGDPRGLRQEARRRGRAQPGAAAREAPGPSRRATRQRAPRLLPRRACGGVCRRDAAVACRGRRFGLRAGERRGDGRASAPVRRDAASGGAVRLPGPGTGRLAGRPWESCTRERGRRDRRRDRHEGSAVGPWVGGDGQSVLPRPGGRARVARDRVPGGP